MEKTMNVEVCASFKKSLASISDDQAHRKNALRYTEFDYTK